LTCGVEGNARGGACMAFLRNEPTGILWMMCRGGSELWWLSFDIKTCYVGWILWFSSFKPEETKRKYSRIHPIDGHFRCEFGESKSTKFRLTSSYFASNTWSLYIEAN
jgi:hypothetical protein